VGRARSGAMARRGCPRLHAISMNGSVLLFSVGRLSAHGVLIFGLAPAVQGSKSRFVRFAKDATRGGTSGGARNRLRAVLVAGQLAMALILLIGSGVLIRSFLKLQKRRSRCDPTGLLHVPHAFAGPQFAKPTGLYHGLPLWDIRPDPGSRVHSGF